MSGRGRQPHLASSSVRKRTDEVENPAATQPLNKIDAPTGKKRSRLEEYRAMLSDDDESDIEVAMAGEEAGEKGVLAEDDDEDENVVEAAKERKTVKKRAKLTPELLVSSATGIQRLLRIRKYFPREITAETWSKEGSEAAMLGKLLEHYEEWAKRMLPDLKFRDFMSRLEHLPKITVKEKLVAMRMDERERYVAEKQEQS